MLTRLHVHDAINAGNGILRLEPCWVPRTFMMPGRRLRLHPDDFYALGCAPGRHQRTMVRVDDERRQRTGNAG